MTTTNNNIISTGFQRAFTLKSFSQENPVGTVRRFPRCESHDEPRFRVALTGLGFFLIQEDSRDNGFLELSRELLPVHTICSFGYHDDEHGGWMRLTDRVAVVWDQAIRGASVTPSNRPEFDLELDPITMRTDMGNVEVVE